MATRSRRTWKPDPRGYYSRQLGWERSRSGKLQQHKFLLGTDRKEAERRERKLSELWDTFAASCQEDRPLWPDDLLIIAKRIAKGTPEIPIPRGPSEKQHQYAARIQRMQAKYPVVLFLPEDQHAYEVGQAALEMFEAIPDVLGDFPIPNPNVEVLKAFEDAKKRLEEVGVSFSPELGVLSAAVEARQEPLPGVLKPSDPAARRTEKPSSNPGDARAKLANLTNPQAANGATQSVTPRTPTTTLYQALKAYQRHLETEYFDPALGHISPWGKTQVRQVQNLKKHHADLLLARLDADAVTDLIGYWRRRPCKLESKDPMTAKSASNFLGTLRRFFVWLDETSQFDWKKPFAFSDINTKVRRLTSDHARKNLQQVDTFSLTELRLLMRYAQPFDRLLLLLGLNCGFGRAEIASLLIGEVHLFSAHSKREQEILDYQTTDDDSFIKRIRRKSGVYGEHILFPMTVKGIQWALERRREFSDFGPDGRLVVTAKGTALDKATKSSNANQTIPNHFNRLIERIKADDNDISKLSFGKLRKTATDLVKRFSDGEIAGVFDCHGSPVRTDSLSDQYSNRPFGRVFQAIREVQGYLAPVFKEAGPAPFAPQAQAYTKRSTIDRIVEMHQAGYPTGQIAAAVGLSGDAVSRHIHQNRERAQQSSTSDAE
ncbi:hypothetical protein [Lignipirellula cremea]|uniref:Core-binding (CB) domain-containing protein n=1 Tax=Lignipirellula cremea TaxID=2528010 RepID=A0A518DWR5_9BACT|nr:hypothetical protein [Lignipirellula cremea]QDU96273.1 hypothetical protein Pla8534_40920 [Lignipirellula cremea]